MRLVLALMLNELAGADPRVTVWLKGLQWPVERLMVVRLGAEARVSGALPEIDAHLRKIRGTMGVSD